MSRASSIRSGLWDGSTENATVATTRLANLVERGLDVEQGVLVVIDGAKALRKPVRDVLGVHTPVQRCVRHKERNVLAHLPERDRPLVRRRLRAAWALDDHDRALEQLRVLAGELARTHPGAAASLREGTPRDREATAPCPADARHGHGQLTRAGKKTITVRLGRVTRKRLAGRKTTRVTVRVRAVDPSGNATTRSTTITLTR